MESRNALGPSGVPSGRPRLRGQIAGKGRPAEALLSRVEVCVDLAPNALRVVLYFDLAAEFLRQAALDEPRAESLSPRRNDRRAVLFRWKARRTSRHSSRARGAPC